MKKSILLIVLMSLFFSCNEDKKTKYTSMEINKDIQVHPGKELIEINCYVCHSPTASHENRLGPPMIAIKKHYIGDDTSKAQFIKDIQAWVQNPTEENAKMFGAVKRFGVMPKAPYPEETIGQIADYMFDHDIEQPEWFEEHFNEQRGKGMGNGKGKNMMQGKGYKRQ